MEDHDIVELFLMRDETAIERTSEKYGNRLRALSYGIVNDAQTAEECENDTYLEAWNSIPPHAPTRFSAFIGKIARNTAIDRYMQKRAQKRNAGVELALDELSECLPSYSEGNMTEELALKHAIDSFLESLPKRTRIIFMRRYWYMSSIKEIADGLSISESNVKVILMRTRERFREHLENEGIVI